MVSRRQVLSTAALLAGGAALKNARAATSTEKRQGYTPVVTPNGATLPYKMENGVKVFHLTAEPVKHELAPGLSINAWGYNGRTPGPTIEAVEGDRVRI